MTPTEPPSHKASAPQGPPAAVLYDDGVGHPREDHEELANEDVAHEHSDVNVRGVLAFGAGMVVVAAAAFLSMWVLFRVLDAQAVSNDPDVSPLAVPAGKLPPTPRLQTNEPASLHKFRSMETETLETYGWVNQSAGVVRIPIAEAKKKLLEHGLPARPSAADPSVGTHAPAMAEPSGGRTIKR
jgi:hypothetical protein